MSDYVRLITAMVLLCAAFVPAVCAKSRTVLIEAEAFDDPGGWVLDQQGQTNTFGLK